MSYPIVKVTGFGDCTLNLKLSQVGEEKSVKDLLKLKSVHEDCGGSIGRSETCKECGVKSPKRVLVDCEGNKYEKASKTAGTFEVIGVVPIDNVSYRWESNIYLAEVEDEPQTTAALVKSLKSKGIVGYFRMNASSDERPAVIFSPEPGVLALTTLYYSEVEVPSFVPAFESAPNALVKKMRDSVKSLDEVDISEITRREIAEAKKTWKVKEAKHA